MTAIDQIPDLISIDDRDRTNEFRDIVTTFADKRVRFIRGLDDLFEVLVYHSQDNLTRVEQRKVFTQGARKIQEYLSEITCKLEQLETSQQEDYWMK